ncbi:MAG: efflux RND transporter periplasmic adaptor subunit [Alphaproteobacteria bacterium]|nr:efflux RND transporter periplasmic adaptor subunit [Alphaproteobacteria bacterium]
MLRLAYGTTSVRAAVIVVLWLATHSGAVAADEPAPAQGPTPAVIVASATPRSITRSATHVGRAQAIKTVNLVARVSGFLQRQAFADGQQVRTGDLLFAIEPDSFKAAVAQAEATLAKAQAVEKNAALTLQRSQELVRTNAVPQSTVDQNVADRDSARADVLAAQASLDQAKINLGYTEVRAPIDGRIGRILVSVGNYVGPTAGTLATIVTQDPIYVFFPVSTQQFIEYKQRVADRSDGPTTAVVRLKLPSGQYYPHTGPIDFYDIQTNRGTDTLTVRAQLPNPDGWLLDGQIVDVTVEVGQPKQVLTIPQAALQLDRSGSYVLVVDDDDKVVQRRVTLGATEGSEVVVEQGLQAGERVIVEGVQKVHAGQKVVTSPAPRDPQAARAPQATP